MNAEKTSFGRNIALTIVCLILGIMVAWQYKSINYNESIMSYENRREEALKEDLIKLQKSNADLRVMLQKLQEDVRLYETAQAGSDESYRKLLDELEIVRIFAGKVDVKGKGVIITLEDMFYTVIGSDILDVVNELRAAGAQAISVGDAVNDERIAAMTEIRDASPYIMINGTQITAPVTIKAIGDPEQMEHSLKMINGVFDKLQEYLEITIKQSDEVFIPKIRDDGSVIKTNLLTPVTVK
ncbi:MAG TPA: DUF881 domain-containing protein [Clostridiales bacterium]|nr:DUF881 domain-containing protein [Clostridiales bacterium]